MPLSPLLFTFHIKSEFELRGVQVNLMYKDIKDTKLKFKISNRNQSPFNLVVTWFY